MKFWINISVSLAAVLVTLLMCELVVSFFASYWFRNNFTDSSLVMTFGNCRVMDFRMSQPSSFYKLSDAPGIFYEHKPNASGTLFGQEVRLNSFGMRDDEVTLEKPAGTYRIALLGDSTAFGYGMPRGEYIADLLEERLRANGAKAEVLNFAVTGYSTDQQIAELRQQVLPFSPDLVLVIHHLNDIYGPSVTSLTPSPILKFLAAHSSLFGCFNQGGKLVNSQPTGVSHQFSGSYEEVYANPKAWESYTTILQDLKAVGIDNDVPIAMAYLPIFKDLNKYPYTQIQDEIARKAEMTGIKNIKMYPPYVSFPDSPESYRVFGDDIDHPNLKGNALLTDIIYNELIRYQLLPR